jgi:ADP-dependent NAD(P)H-hydrate dehydratase
MALGVTRRRTAASSTLITPALLRRLPLPTSDGRYGKESRGSVLVVGGSDQVPGAVVLAATGALRAGAGKVQVATSDRVGPWIGVSVPEARVLGLRGTRDGELASGAGRRLRAELQACDVLLVGPGMMDARAGIELVRQYLRASAGPALIVDAAPLDAFRGRQSPGRHARPIVITPHAGEMARLCGISREAVLEAPVQIARETAARLGVVVALKGARTYVAGPDGTVFQTLPVMTGWGSRARAIPCQASLPDSPRAAPMRCARRCGVSICTRAPVICWPAKSDPTDFWLESCWPRSRACWLAWPDGRRLQIIPRQTRASRRNAPSKLPGAAVE